MPSIDNILERNTLRNTDIRRKVLQLFVENDYALSHHEIEQSLGKVDRITLYRTLKTFEEKGIIHKAFDGQNETRYALCRDDCHAGHHEDDHIHFYCKKCNKTYCLPHVELPSVNTPRGFSIDETYFFVQGTCKSCE